MLRVNVYVRACVRACVDLLTGLLNFNVWKSRKQPWMLPFYVRQSVSVMSWNKVRMCGKRDYYVTSHPLPLFICKEWNNMAAPRGAQIWTEKNNKKENSTSTTTNKQTNTQTNKNKQQKRRGKKEKTFATWTSTTWSLNMKIIMCTLCYVFGPASVRPRFGFPLNC